MFVVWEKKLFVLGRMLWGWGELSWGLFSNFFCTFGTVTINVPPLYCRVFFPSWNGESGSLNCYYRAFFGERNA